MSVLIKGMEMPKNCEECALNYDSFSCIKTGSSFFRDNDSEFDPFKARLEDCPLIPVPPHGDLIDRDAYQYSGDLMDEPVIIPAEEGLADGV